MTDALNKSERQRKPARDRAVVIFLGLALAAGVFVPSHGARASIALVNTANNAAGAAVSSISQTLNVTSGNLLVVVCRQGTTSNDLQSVSDTAGNTFFPVIASAIPKTQTDMIKMWYAKNTKGNSADAVTCSLGQSLANSMILVLQYSGADPVSPLDAKATGVVESSAGTNSTSATTTAFSTAAANEVIVACGSVDQNGTDSAGTGYTMEVLANGGNDPGCEDQIVSQTQQNVTATMKTTIAAGWEIVLGSFRAYVQGTTVSSRSDTLADPRPSATSNHAFAFTVNTAVYGSSLSGSSTLTLSLDPAFTFPDALDCGDIDAATGVQFNFNWPSCVATATAWGFSVQQSGISFVQMKDGSTGNLTSQSITFTNNTNAGDLIVVRSVWNSTTINMSSVTDSAGNTYASASGPVNWGGDAPTAREQIFYAKNIHGGANTVTATLNSAAPSLLGIDVFEYSGVDPISPLDRVSSASSSSGTAMDSGSATTTYPNELIFGVGDISNTAPHPGTGFVNRSNIGGTQLEDKFVATASSYKATATGDGTAWLMMMATFRASGGSTLTLTPPSGTGVYVPTSTQVTIKIGANATVGQQGAHWITNPSAAGIYTISVGGTFGGSGNMLVAIQSAVTVQATVAESLALTVLPSVTSIKFVQKTDANGPSGSKLTMPAFGSANSSGDLIVVAVIWNNNSDAVTILSVTDTVGDVFVSPPGLGKKDGVSSLAGFSIQTFYAKNVVGGSGNQVTVNFSGAAEYSGADTASPFDIGASQALANTANGTSPAVTTSLPKELLVGTGAFSGVCDATCGGTGWAVRSTVGGNVDIEDEIATTVGSYQSQFINSAQDGIYSVGAFKPAPGCIADDSASVTQIITSATSVPFGFISPNTFYQGCQDLIVSTNAGNGYSVTVQESSAMRTADARFTIPDTTCDAGDCSVVTATTWVTPTKNGFGHTCTNQSGSDCNPTYGNGKKFKSVSNIAAGNNGATISFVQANTGICLSCTSTTTAFTSANTAGNLIVVAITYDDTVSLTSVTDTQGNVYVRAGTEVDRSSGGNPQKADIYYAKNIKGGANAVTAQLNGPSNNVFFEVYVHEYSGLDPTSPLDVTASSTGNSTNLDSGPATTNFANELIFGWGAMFSGSSMTAGTGFTPRENFGDEIVEDKVVSAVGTYDAVATNNSSNNWFMQMATFKAKQNVGQTLMSNTGTVTNSTGRVKYRLSVPSNQAAGTYTTIISYTIYATY